MAKVIFVMGLLLLAMFAAADDSGEDSSSNVVQVSLKVTSECKKTDVFILVGELGDGKPKKCKRKEKTDIGPFDLDLNLKHLIHLEFSLMNGKKADFVIDLLQLGLVDNVEDLLIDLVEDLVENTVKCSLNGQPPFLSMPL